MLLLMEPSQNLLEFDIGRPNGGSKDGRTGTMSNAAGAGRIGGSGASHNADAQATPGNHPGGQDGTFVTELPRGNQPGGQGGPFVTEIPRGNLAVTLGLSPGSLAPLHLVSDGPGENAWSDQGVQAASSLGAKPSDPFAPEASAPGSGRPPRTLQLGLTPGAARQQRRDADPEDCFSGSQQDQSPSRPGDSPGQGPGEVGEAPDGGRMSLALAKTEQEGGGDLDFDNAGGAGSGEAIRSGGRLVSRGSRARGNAEDKTGSSRYESQKKRDWSTFGQYLRNHRPPIPVSQCTSQHVLEFLAYLDQFGKTKVHEASCQFFGSPGSNPCACPMKQAWGSLDSLVGRLRAAYEENGESPETNPFAHRTVRVYLREVKDAQAKARGMDYEKRKRKKDGEEQDMVSSRWALASSADAKRMRAQGEGQAGGDGMGNVALRQGQGGAGGQVLGDPSAVQDPGQLSLEQLQAEQRLVLQLLRQQQALAASKKLDPSAATLMEALVRRGLALGLGPHILAPPGAKAGAAGMGERSAGGIGGGQETGRNEVDGMASAQLGDALASAGLIQISSAGLEQQGATRLALQGMPGVQDPLESLASGARPIGADMRGESGLLAAAQQANALQGLGPAGSMSAHGIPGVTQVSAAHQMRAPEEYSGGLQEAELQGLRREAAEPRESLDAQWRRGTDNRDLKNSFCEGPSQGSQRWEGGMNLLSSATGMDLTGGTQSLALARASGMGNAGTGQSQVAGQNASALSASQGQVSLAGLGNTLSDYGSHGAQMNSSVDQGPLSLPGGNQQLQLLLLLQQQQQQQLQQLQLLQSLHNPQGKEQTMQQNQGRQPHEG